MLRSLGPKKKQGQYYSSGGNKKIVHYLDDFLMERTRKIELDPSLKIKAQRGVFYRIRPIMIDEGFDPKEKDSTWGRIGEYIAGFIQERCDKLFGKKREDLGIVASSRATMYYDGDHY